MKNIIAISIALLAFSACQKVINVDIKNTAPQIVIEGNVANDGSPMEVKVSKTINFSASNSFQGTSNAIVTINDNSGNLDTLTETAAGIYQSTANIGVAGKNYTLNVWLDGKNYTSTSTMPSVTKLDTLVSFVSGFGGNKIITPVYLDPINVKNYYKFVMTVNGVETKDLFIRDDKYNDGLYATRPLFSREEDPLKTGDLVTIKMQCIDANAYLYWYSLNQNQNTTPANPTSNISNGALGYFSTNSVSSKNILIQ